MRKLQLTVFLSLVAFLSGNAFASIILGPDDANWSGSIPGNPDADDIETITGNVDDLFLLYKSNVDDPEEGPFLSSYNTEYFNEPDDPEDATVSYVGGDIMDAKYAIVKDGNHDPIWYIFDLTETTIDWDGVVEIEFQDFWPGPGGIISHVGFYGESLDPLDPLGGVVPEPTSFLCWSVLAIGGVCLVRRRHSA